MLILSLQEQMKFNTEDGVLPKGSDCHRSGSVIIMLQANATLHQTWSGNKRNKALARFSFLQIHLMD